MDFSKFKFELYDILALVLPGFLILCGAWVLLRGWHVFAVSLTSLSGTGFTALLLASFPLGHLIQELGDAALKKFFGSRFFKQARDHFWDTNEGKNISAVIDADCGLKLPVDGAFDYCLTKIKGQFPRRDVFIATSDFCRSLLVVGILLIPTVARLIVDLHDSHRHVAVYSVLILLVLLLYLFLCWRRMLRFRELSETTVFRTYLACRSAAARQKEEEEGTEE